MSAGICRSYMVLYLQRQTDRARRACDAKPVLSDNDAEPFRHQRNMQLIAYPA